MGNKIPSSWFDDDPEWELLRHKAENRPVPRQLKQKVVAQRPQLKREPRELPRAQASKEVSGKEVVLNLKLAVPKIRLPDGKKLYREHKRKILVATGVTVCLVVAVGAIQIISNYRTSRVAVGEVSAEDRAKETFTPLVPLKDLKDANGKQTTPEYAYDDKKQVLGYSSEYNGAVITISQQALPEKMRSNPGELAYIAKNIDAHETLETQKGRAYIATDEKSGAQTAIFATDEVLVFLRTNKKLDSEEWKFYINQLNPAG